MIRWTTYDGTPETLPPSGRDITWEQKRDYKMESVRTAYAPVGFPQRPLGLLWEIEPGDRWVIVPTQHECDAIEQLRAAAARVVPFAYNTVNGATFCKACYTEFGSEHSPVCYVGALITALATLNSTKRNGG